MSDDKIDRIARLIFTHLFTVLDEWRAGNGEFDPDLLDPLSRPRWHDCRDAARAILAADDH